MKVFLLASLLAIACLCHAQMGYIYVHTQAINEESTPAGGFSFAVSGGSTTVPDFSLNDRPDIANTNILDIGSASYADASGELWAIIGGTTTNVVYRRAAASSAWTQATGVTGSPTNIDGAGTNQFVYTNGTNAYIYSNGTSKAIYTASASSNNANSNSTAINITYGGGYIFLVTTNGSVLVNNNISGVYAGYSDSWTIVSTGRNVRKIDTRSSASTLVFSTTGNNVYTANYTIASGSVTSYTTTSVPTDVSIGDDGSIFAILGSVYKWTGTAFAADANCPSGIAITAGPGGQAWMIPNWGYNPRTIYTRGVDNVSGVHWMDDERVRTTYTGNSILIPVAAGSYTITESKPSGWDIQGMIIYDPSGGSTGSPSTNTATITVAAGEVVNLIVQNEYLLPIAMQKQCISNQVAEDFGTPTSVGVATTVTSGGVTASVGPAPAGITAYHKFNGTRFDDGYYSIVTQSLGWGNTGILDHTTGAGYYMLVNASYQTDQFYRKRITNLVPGVTYTVGFWAIQVGSGGISPNILFGVSDSNAVVLNTFSTGAFTNQVWQQYKFNFTATTSVSDIYLQNNAAGGGGNDLGIDDITFTPLSTPLAKLTVPAAVLCANNTTYQFTETPSGGLWTSSNTATGTINSSSGLFTGVAPGTTTVHYILTNAIGCITDSSAIATVTEAPAVTTAAATTIVCSGEVINLISSPSGGTPSYTYTWSSTTGTFTGSQIIQNTTAKQTSAGSYTYSLLVTDTKGCKATSSTTVNVSGNPAPAVTVAPGSATGICAGGSVALTSSPSGGTSPYGYAWSGSGIGTTTAQNTSAVPTATGVYNLTITDSKGCKVTASTATVTVNPLPAVTISTGSGVLCSNQSLALNSFPTSGTPTYSYLWTGSSGATITGGTTVQNTTAKPTVAGSYTYSLVVTDSKGCTASDAKTIAVTLSNNTPPAVSVTPTGTSTICSLSSLNLTSTPSSGTTPYTFLWSSTTGAGIATPSTQNTSVVPTVGGSFVYTMTVTDKNGCTGTANTGVVTVNPSPTITASSFASALCSGQTIDTLYSTPGSGTVPYSYLWTASPSTNSGLSSANNTLQNAPVLPTATGTYVYTIKVTDSKTCFATATTSIAVSNTTAPTISAISPSSATVICGGTGSVNLSGTTGSGGTTPFTYAWAGSGVAAPTALSTTATPASSGSYNYILKVRDNIGCVATATTATVTVNPALTVTVSNSSTALCNGATVSLGAVPGGGTGTYSSYAWSASATAAGLGATNTQNTSATPTAAGSYLYSVLLTDSKGCTVTGSTPTITRDGPFTVAASVSSTTVCSGTSIDLTAVPTGGSLPLTYAWIGSTGGGLGASNIQNTTAVPTASGSNYGILVVDNHGCTSSASTASVTVNALPVVSATAAPTAVCAGSSVALSSTASGASPFSYVWTGSGLGATNTQNTSAIPTASGSFSVQVTDANTCKSIAGTSSVTVNALPGVTATAAPTALCAGGSVALSSTASGAGPFSYVWTGSGLGAINTQNTSAIPTASGSFSVQVTDANTCKSTAGTSSVTVNALPVANFTISGICSFDFTATNAGTGATYNWNFGSDANPVTAAGNSVLDVNYTSNGTKNITLNVSSSANCPASITKQLTVFCSLLPLDLLDFKAAYVNGQVRLKWLTANEKGIAHFIVERSLNGSNYTSIGQVAATNNGLSGTGTYSLADANIADLSGIVYYRLTIVDKDGNISYSSVEKIVLEKGKEKLYVVNAGGNNILVHSNKSNVSAKIALYNTTGQLMLKKELVLENGLNNIGVLNAAAGIYYVECKTKENVYHFTIRK